MATNSSLRGAVGDVAIQSGSLDRHATLAMTKHLGIIQLGDFTLKSGEKSDFYVDFRKSLGHPKLFKNLGLHMARLSENLHFDLICGVPDAAVPLATSIALNLEIPLLMCRKIAKQHGQKKMVEGVFVQNQRCLLVEDVVTTGGSILETATILREHGLAVSDCLSLLCRKQQLQIPGIAIHSLFNLEELRHAPRGQKNCIADAREAI